MTTTERAARVLKMISDGIEVPYTIQRDLLADCIDAAVKEATEDVCLGYAKLTEDHHSLMLLARELAAKHMRGNQCCTFCGAAPYMNQWTHAEGCAVKRLDALERGAAGR